MSNVTELPAFRRWFGASKVVDTHGAPLIVFHGTPDVRGLFVGGGHVGREGKWMPLDSVRPGFQKSPSRGMTFFAVDRADVALSYADPHRAWDYQGSEPAVVPLYLSIQNPLVIDAKGQHWRGTEAAIQEAKRLGHDGIVILRSVDYYSNDKRAKPATVFAFFEPTQAKSALTGPLLSTVDKLPIPGTGPNIGTFDPSDGDLTRNMQSNPPIDRLTFIEKTYGKTQPWVVLDTLSVIMPTIGIDGLRDAVEETIGWHLDSGEWRSAGIARHSKGGEYGDINRLYSSNTGDLLPALTFTGWDIPKLPIIPETGHREIWSGYTNSEGTNPNEARPVLLLLDLVRSPRFDERMREPHQADGIYPWVASQLSKLSKAVFQNRTLYPDYVASLNLLRKRGNAIAQWAKQNRIDLGKKTLAEVLEATAKFKVTGGSMRQGTIVFDYGDGWTMQELRSKRELEDEGKRMQHCVGGYCKQVEEGRSQIFSLRDNLGDPHATIEYVPPTAISRPIGRFDQIYGPQNDPIRDPAIIDRIVQWLHAKYPDDVSGELLLGAKDFRGRKVDLRDFNDEHHLRFRSADFAKATILTNVDMTFDGCHLDSATLQLFPKAPRNVMLTINLSICDASGMRVELGNGPRQLNISQTNATEMVIGVLTGDHRGTGNYDRPALYIDSAKSYMERLKIMPGIDVVTIGSRDTNWSEADLRNVDFGRSNDVSSFRELEEILSSDGVMVDENTLPAGTRAEMYDERSRGEVSARDLSDYMHETDDGSDDYA